MKIVDLYPDDGRLLRDLLPVLRELRPHLTEELFREVYEAGHPQGLVFSAAYDAQGICVGAAGWRVVDTTHSIRKLTVDDLVTAEHARSSGVGHEMVAYLEGRAKQLGCRGIDLQSAVVRSDAHRFYFRERFAVVAFHFGKALT